MHWPKRDRKGPYTGPRAKGSSAQTESDILVDWISPLNCISNQGERSLC